MGREEVVAVASRLLAVYLVVVAFKAAMAPFSVPATPEYFVYQFALALFVLGIAAILWFFPVSVARKLLPVMRQPPPPLELHGRVALSLALAVLGAWLFVQAVAEVAYWFTVFALSSDSEHSMPLLPEHYGGMVQTAVELLLSVVLVVGNKGISNWLYRLRYGVQPAPETKQSAL